VADTSAPGRLAGVPVLLVEDEAQLRDFLREVLAYAGALITTASSAREVLPLISVADVIVTELLMPGEDGLWLLAQVEQSPHPVPVVLVTSVADRSDLTGAKFARVVRKPVDHRHLCGAIWAAVMETRVAHAVLANLPHAYCFRCLAAQLRLTEKAVSMAAQLLVVRKEFRLDQWVCVACKRLESLLVSEKPRA
jgi:CheY-like chemotaxis protein